MSTRMFRPASSVARQGVASQRLFHASRPAFAVHHVKTAEEFKKVVKDQNTVIVDCFATWCGPCKAIAPILEKSVYPTMKNPKSPLTVRSRASEDAEFKDKVHFVKFDVDELPELSQELGIRAMPTFLFYKNGSKVDEMIGANPPVLLQTLRKHKA
ncbi:Thioredoxin, putative [Trichoderma parareesei]|uniref:Thioredoxin, putative n=1 Tax=Trichoderma parareesei TaxID=858221 RepID=A0A2H2Z4H5_TRIPA|nr:Thioredoxin, putative [Trichoderma parareesei]